jgi:membrane protein
MSSAPDRPSDQPSDPPDEPTDLPRRSWRDIGKRTLKEFRDDNLTDWAAALTYYAILSLFPALLVLVSLLGLLGQSTTNTILDNLTAVAPGSARSIITDAIRNLQSSQGAAGVLFFVGIATALWSASGYIGAFMRASNAIYEVPEGRPFWKLRPVQLLITFILLVLLVAAALGVLLTGSLAEQAGKILGIGDTAVQVWDIAKWPVIVVIVMVMLAILYWAAPNVRQPGFRWITPGSAVALLLWLVASAGFALYVANFGSYNKTYGSLGGVIVFLIWLWITNLAVLFGQELNAELERERELQAGTPGAQEEIQLEPRQAPKADADAG